MTMPDHYVLIGRRSLPYINGFEDLKSETDRQGILLDSIVAVAINKVAVLVKRCKRD